MEVRCKENCPCCETFKDCVGFHKIVDLKNLGLVIYRHRHRIEEVNKSTGLLKSSMNTRDDIFIVHNTKDTQIRADECISEIDQGISCARCRELLQRAKKYLRGVPPIDKKDIISVCDHCQQNRIKKKKLNFCYKCQDVLKKYHAEELKQVTAKEHIKTWLSNVDKSENVRIDKTIKKTLKHRSHSDLYLNNICKTTIGTDRYLEVRPILEKGVRMTESIHFIEKDTKSESGLKFSESEYIKSKSVLIRADSLMKIERYFSPSVTTHDTQFVDKSRDRNEEFQIVKGILQRDTELPYKMKKKPRTSLSKLRKYFSEDDLFFSAAGLTGDMEKNFSYVFPKGVSDKVEPLRRVKTSAELILDTQKMLRQRYENEKKYLQERKIIIPDIKLRNGEEKKTASADEDNKPIENKSESVESNKSKKAKSDEENEKNSKIKKTKSLKEIYSKELKRKKGTDQYQLPPKKEDKLRLLEEKKDRLQREKETKQKDKEEKQREKENKEGEKERKQKDKEEKQREKEEKQREKGEKRREKEANQREKEGQQKDKEEKHREKEEKQREKGEKQREKETKQREKKGQQKDKEEKQGEKDEKQMEEEEKQREKEVKQREKEAKEAQQQNATDTKQRIQEVQKIQLQEEKELKQFLKDEQKRIKEDKEKSNKFEKLLAETTQKHEIPQFKKQQNEEDDTLKTEIDKKKKEKAEQISKALKDSKADKKYDEEKSKSKKTQEEPTGKESNIKQIKMRMSSPDDLILKLVKLRQDIKGKDEEKPKRLSEINITPLMVNEHKKVHSKKMLSCVMCLDSELELDVDSLINTRVEPETTDVIVGNKIFKCKLPLREAIRPEEISQMLYKSVYTERTAVAQEREHIENITNQKEHKSSPVSDKYGEQELPKGVIRYALSDRSFIDKGWTRLPTEKVVRKMNVYRMRPAHPEFDWFERNKNKRLMLYDTGEKLAEFDDKGRGRWFYRNSRIALDYYDAEEMNAQQRFVIYGSGEPDDRGRYQPIAILATFDYLGNGVVFDHAGKVRLKYNQTEGVVLDRSIGPVSHWKWHTLNDPPVLQQVMIDTQMAHKDPDIMKLGGPADDKVRPDNEEMLAIEFDNFIKEKSKKLSQKFKPFQIRTKALKINENFSLKVLDQANIYLIFRDGTTNIKLNIGMILDHQEIVDTDTAEVGEVSNNLERFPARTDSLAGLQRSVAYAQRVERQRLERDRRLRHPEPSSSADKLVSAASRPLKPKLHTVRSISSVARDDICNCRKRSTCNVYYDTRFI